MTLTFEQIAIVAHNTNIEYCKALGTVGVPWSKRSEAERKGAVEAVKTLVSNSKVTPEELHEAWSSTKIEDGWKYAPVTDIKKKENSLLVPYSELSLNNKAKGHIFRGVVMSLANTEIK